MVRGIANIKAVRRELITKAMDEELSRYFFDEASRTFQFLVSEYSFSPPQFQVEDKIHFAFVTFVGKNLAIECILDGRESDIDCKVARVIEGRKTTHYAVDESGTRVREGLASLLRRHGVREPLFRSVQDLELRQRIKVTLSDFATMLKKHGQEVLNDSASVFE